MSARDMDEWLKNGGYLPEAMRDFHDQKDIFKAIHETVNVEGHDYCKEISWVSGQCYVIDIFLWFMARRGYTLQKSRAKVKFRDLYDDVQTNKEERDRQHSKLLRNSFGGPMQ